MKIKIKDNSHSIINFIPNKFGNFDLNIEKTLMHWRHTLSQKTKKYLLVKSSQINSQARILIKKTHDAIGKFKLMDMEKDKKIKDTIKVNSFFADETLKYFLLTH